MFASRFFSGASHFFTLSFYPVRLRSLDCGRPAKGCSPFDPRQGAPCTCPALPFTAKPGLCFSRNFAVETSVFVNNTLSFFPEKKLGGRY